MPPKSAAAVTLVPVYPVTGRFLLDVPHVETVTDAATAAALVETGAFTYDQPSPAPDAPAESEE